MLHQRPCMPESSSLLPLLSAGVLSEADVASTYRPLEALFNLPLGGLDDSDHDADLLARSAGASPLASISSSMNALSSDLVLSSDDARRRLRLDDFGCFNWLLHHLMPLSPIRDVAIGWRVAAATIVLLEVRETTGGVMTTMTRDAGATRTNGLVLALPTSWGYRRRPRRRRRRRC